MKGTQFWFSLKIKLNLIFLQIRNTVKDLDKRLKLSLKRAKIEIFILKMQLIQKL